MRKFRVSLGPNRWETVRADKVRYDPSRSLAFMREDEGSGGTAGVSYSTVAQFNTWESWQEVFEEES